MKKITAVLMFCLMLTACGGNQDTTDITTTAIPSSGETETTTVEPTTTETAETTTAPVRFTLYTPNENCDGFYATEIVVSELDANTIVQELVNEGVLTAEILVNSAELEGAALALDFNGAFADLIITQGSTGERMLIGSIVNTFLSAFGAETVTITVDGSTLESGHVVYDFPMEFFK